MYILGKCYKFLKILKRFIQFPHERVVSIIKFCLIYLVTETEYTCVHTRDIYIQQKSSISMYLLNKSPLACKIQI